MKTKHNRFYASDHYFNTNGISTIISKTDHKKT